jgi:hypothetical protein
MARSVALVIMNGLANGIDFNLSGGILVFLRRFEYKQPFSLLRAVL